MYSVTCCQSDRHLLTYAHALIRVCFAARIILRDSRFPLITLSFHVSFSSLCFSVSFMQYKTKDEMLAQSGFQHRNSAGFLVDVRFDSIASRISLRIGISNAANRWGESSSLNYIATASVN